MRFAFGEKKTDSEGKEEVSKELKAFEYKLSKYKRNSNEIEKEDARREAFKEEYKMKHGEDATDNQINDYLADKSYEDMLQKEIDMEEGYNFARANEDDPDVLDVGDGYGELPQGMDE